MTLKITIEGMSEDEANTVLQNISPSAQIIIKNYGYHNQEMENRKELILKTVKKLSVDNKGVNIGKLYKKVRISGYTMRYKTLQRDIRRLVDDEIVKTTEVIGGGFGSTTIVEII